MTAPTQAAPFCLPVPSDSSLQSSIVRLAARGVESLLGLSRLNRIYAEVASRTEPAEFVERAMAGLRKSWTVADGGICRVPASGPLIVVANHPFGALDGIILTAMLRRVRADVRLLANYLLHCIPEMHATTFFVDPFDTPGSVQRNRTSMRAALEWLRAGGVLGVFPAGEVSHLTIATRTVTDPRWNNVAARLAWKTGAAVLPVYFEGRNSGLFQAAGLLHPRLRTALLPRELLGRRNKRVVAHIGSPITAERLAKIGSDEQRTEYLRLRTYILKAHAAPKPASAPRAAPRRAAAIVAALPADRVALEIESLPAERVLARSGALAVVLATQYETPTAIREVGRLREATFRAVGEGTGREIDLDEFDEYYRHLVIWDTEKKQVAGSYRMGLTDEIVAARGIRGLYTRSLFRFDEKLLAQTGPALELGRSFVSAEYQRSYAPLLLLWRGIAAFASSKPRYRTLFGAVSISDRYHTMTRQLLLAFLRTSCDRTDLSPLIQAKRPPRMVPPRDFDPRLLSTAVRDIGEVDELVAEIETELRATPVLLRQYLKLNAKLLAFSVDPQFGGVLDGLVMVDLMQVDPPVLARYMGADRLAEFRSFHGDGGTTQAT